MQVSDFFAAPVALAPTCAELFKGRQNWGVCGSLPMRRPVAPQDIFWLSVIDGVHLNRLARGSRLGLGRQSILGADALGGLAR